MRSGMSTARSYSVLAGVVLAASAFATHASADVRTAYANAFLSRIDHRDLPAKFFPSRSSILLAAQPSTPAAALGEVVSILLGDDARDAAPCLGRIEIEEGERCAAGVAACVTGDERETLERGAAVELKMPLATDLIRFRTSFDDASELRTFFETTEVVDLTRIAARAELLACLDERLPPRVTELVVPRALYRVRAASFTSRQKDVNIGFALAGHTPIDTAVARWSNRSEARGATAAAWRLADLPPPVPRGLRSQLAPYVTSVVSVSDLPGRSWDWRITTPARLDDVTRAELRWGGSLVAKCAAQCASPSVKGEEGTCTMHALACPGIVIPEAEQVGDGWSLVLTTKKSAPIEWRSLPIQVHPVSARIDSCVATAEKEATKLTCNVATAKPKKPLRLAVFGANGAEVASSKPGTAPDRSTSTMSVVVPAQGTRDVVAAVIEGTAVVHRLPVALAAGAPAGKSP